ncbi:hypothetical protein TMatcc_006399 [Talaromyces marneffei ATCC 18224]
MPIRKLEQQRSIFVYSIREGGFTSLVHVDVVNSRAVGRAEDVDGCVLVDGVGEDGLEFIHDIVVGTRCFSRPLLLGDGVGEVACQPVDESTIRVGGSDVNGGLELPAVGGGVGGVGEEEVNVR